MKEKETKKPKDPLTWFFSLGDKVTKTPKQKADWDYYFLWIIFLAFFSILIGNLIEFYQTQKISSLGWAVVMVGILWFQYGGLKQFYGVRKIMKAQEKNPQPEKELKIDSVDSMLKGFKKNETSNNNKL